MTRRSSLVSRLGSIGRERAKDILVLENLGARRVLHELVRRATQRGGPTDVRLGFCVTASELADFVARPSDFAELIAQRYTLQRYLDDRIPPPWFQGRGLEPGEVLVCAITDPSWTPLFLAAVAVVCESGAVQSHAAIVARELGIPAVLSVRGITAVTDGTTLLVDGTNGTVRIG